MSLLRQVSWEPWLLAPSRMPGQSIALDLDDILNLGNASLPVNDVGLSEVKVKPNSFSVNLDCHQFKQDEIKVKLNDNKLVIHAKHEERKDKDGGFSKREFTRTYLLPNGCLPDKMVAKVTENGALQITCPREIKKEETTKSIPIEFVNSKSIK